MKSVTQDPTSVFLRSVLALVLSLAAFATHAALLVEDERLATDIKDAFQGSLPEFGLDRPENGRQFEEVVRLIRAGDLDGAERLAQRVAAAQSRTHSAHELLGVVLALKGRTEDALKALNHAAKLSPENPSVLTKLGTVLMALNRPDEAKQRFEQALRIDPANRFAHQRMGLIAESRNEIAPAIAHYEKGLAGTPDGYIGLKSNLAGLYNLAGRPEQAVQLLAPLADGARGRDLRCHVVLGTSYLRLGRTEQALSSFRRAVERDSGNAGFQLALAVALRETGDAASALPVLERALSLQPSSDEARFQKAEALLDLKRPKEAADIFRSLADRKIQPARAKSRLAEALLAQGDARAAAVVLKQLSASAGAGRDVLVRWLAAEQASGDIAAAAKAADSLLTRYPDDAVAHFEAARFHAFATRYARAEQLARKALSLKKDDPEILYLIAAIESRSGKTQAAIDTARRLVGLAPGNTSARFLLGSLLQDAGQAAAAAAEYRAVLKARPEHALALNNLAALLADGGKLDEALALARRADAAMPDNGAVLDTLGHIELRQGRHADAARTLGKAVQIQPRQADAHYHLALAYEALGRKNEARSALQRALDIQPDARWASDARERLAKH